MDRSMPAEAGAAPCDPAIVTILERARRLSDAEIVTLARRYRSPGDLPPAERARILDLAIRRSGRGKEVRALEAEVAAVVEAIGTSDAHRALGRLGFLADAERAIAEAALATLLADRLGHRQAADLRNAWEALA